MAGDEFYFDNEDAFPTPVLWSFDWRAVIEAAGFVSPWWPAAGLLIGPGADAGFDALAQVPAKHSDMWRSFGANGRLGFVGVTRDQYGSPLGGCRVRCFLTATTELVSDVVSDGNGNYLATTPYTGAHFIVVHRSGSPDVAGASVDTLQPG